MDIDSNDLISLTILVGGLLAVAAGLVVLVKREIRARRRERADLRTALNGERLARSTGKSRLVFATAAAFALTSVALGLEGIERRGMSHVEVYVPGIDLPAGISEPPPRKGLVHTLRWHFHDEPHPQAYYLFMWGWTKAFGTSLTALRLPSVLFAGGAVLLIFAVGAAVYGNAVGLIAAALLALNGHHVFWSQNARMYEMALFLSLLSLWLWIKILNSRLRRLWIEGGYVAATTLGVYTQPLFWPFLAAQMVFTLFSGQRSHGSRPRAYFLQTLCVILGSPMLAHALYRGRGIASWGSPTLAFAQDYLNFGFLFRPDDWSLVSRDIPWLPELLLTTVALACIYMFVTTRRFKWTPAETAVAPSPRMLVLIAIGFILILVAIAREVYYRNVIVGLVALVPVIAIVQFHLCGRVAQWGNRFRDTGIMAKGWSSPFITTAFLTFALVFVISWFKPVSVSRGLLVAVPPLLIVLAGGLWELTQRLRLVGLIAIILMAAASVSSVVYFREMPRPNDYRGLAEQVKLRLEPNDRIFVKKRDWATTPVFYHLQGEFDRLVAQDYVEAARDAKRVWVLRFSGGTLPAVASEALAAFDSVETVTALRATATLYRRRLPVAESER